MSDAPSAPPRYAALARDLADEIARGRHPVGSRLPTEVELSAERGVSRATVRAALERLEELGLVSRRRRSGTRVTAASPAERLGGYVQSLSGVEDLLQYAAETERRVLRVSPVVADDALAVRLEVPARQPVAARFEPPRAAIRRRSAAALLDGHLRRRRLGTF